MRSLTVLLFAMLLTLAASHAKDAPVPKDTAPKTTADKDAAAKAAAAKDTVTTSAAAKADAAKDAAAAKAAAAKDAAAAKADAAKDAAAKDAAAAKADAAKDAAAARATVPKEKDAWTVPELGMKFVWLNPGTFTMGSPADEAGRVPDETQHDVVLTKGYWCGVYEVTQGEWKSLMGTTIDDQRKAAYEKELFGEGPRFPMYYVTRDDAVAFCMKLTERERALGRVPAGYAYRLPTEAEWEYACRAGTKATSAADALKDHAWYADNSGKTTHEVGGKAANAWGLHDTYGNVWEWCSDWYGDYPTIRAMDPAGAATGKYRVFRGGSWSDSSSRAFRPAHRSWGSLNLRVDNIGFRVVLGVVR